MKLAALLLLAGCDRFLELAPVTYMSDGGGHPGDGVADSAIDARPPPAKLIQARSNGGTNMGSIQVMLPAMPSPNNVLIAIGGASNGVVSVTGSAMWQPVVHSNSYATEYMYVGRPTGGATIALTAQNLSDVFLAVSEWSGIDATLPIDGAKGGAGSGSGTLDIATTTGGAPDLVVFSLAHYGTIAVPQMWIDLPPEATAGAVTQDSFYEFSTASGPIDVQATYQDQYDAVLAAFHTTP